MMNRPPPPPFPDTLGPTQFPQALIDGLIARIDHLAELKMTLFCLWAFSQNDPRDGLYWLRLDDILRHRKVHGLDEASVMRGLSEACARGTLLPVHANAPDGSIEIVWVLHTPTAWQIAGAPDCAARLDAAGRLMILAPRPTVYALYEENIGPLTGLIGDELRTLSDDYGDDWLREAVSISVEQEKRNLAYIKAVLRRWRREGKRHERSERSAERDVAGKYGDFYKR
jgi:DnaD/phage-associated family protein